MGFHQYWPTWPKELEPAAWDKNKGVFAKLIKGETGIGGKLKEAKTAFDHIKAHCFSDMTVDVSTKAACDKAMHDAIAEMSGGVKACEDKLDALHTLAHAQADKFKAPLTPKSSREYVTSIEQKAAQFKTTLHQFCIQSMKDIKDAKDKAST